MLVALCQSTCSCSCRCSTTIMKRMKQAILFGFLVLNMLSLPCLSNGFASHHILCLQESCCGNVLSQKWLLSLVPRPHLVFAMIRECSITDSIMDTAHPRGCGQPPNPPHGSAPEESISMQSHGRVWFRVYHHGTEHILATSFYGTSGQFSTVWQSDSSKHVSFPSAPKPGQLERLC